jgi:hypothetical protein
MLRDIANQIGEKRPHLYIFINMLSLEKIKQLQEILNRVYEENFNLDQATQIANNWAGYFGLLAKLDQRIEYEACGQ